MSYTSGRTPGDDQAWIADDLAEAMEEARPLDAPPLEWLGDPDAVRACQRDAFEVGDEDWWFLGEDWMPFVRDAAGRWVPDPEELALRAAAGSGSAAEG